MARAYSAFFPKKSTHFLDKKGSVLYDKHIKPKGETHEAQFHRFLFLYEASDV